MAIDDMVARPRPQAQKVIGDNARILLDEGQPSAKQWWNLPAKVAAGLTERIQDIADRREWHAASESEALMDTRNNAEGRLAAKEGRPISPDNLQSGLDQPAGSNPTYPRARPRGGGGGWR